MFNKSFEEYSWETYVLIENSFKEYFYFYYFFTRFCAYSVSIIDYKATYQTEVWWGKNHKGLQFVLLYNFSAMAFGEQKGKVILFTVYTATADVISRRFLNRVGLETILLSLITETQHFPP